MHDFSHDVDDDPSTPRFSEITAGPHRLDSKIQFVVSSAEMNKNVNDNEKYHKSNRNVMYVIDAAYFGFNLHWQIRRRYSDFYLFFDRLKRFFARRNVNTCPGCHGFRRALFDFSFPEKNWKGMGNTTSASASASSMANSLINASTRARSRSSNEHSRFALPRRSATQDRSNNNNNSWGGGGGGTHRHQGHERESGSGPQFTSFAEHQVIESRRITFHALVRLVASHTFSCVPKCQFCCNEPFRLVREFFVRDAKWTTVGTKICGSDKVHGHNNNNNNNNNHSKADEQAMAAEFLTGVIVPESFGPIADPTKSKIEFRRGRGIVKVLQIERAPAFQFFRRNRSDSSPCASGNTQRRENNTMLEPTSSSSSLTRRNLNLTEPPMRQRTPVVKVN